MKKIFSSLLSLSLAIAIIGCESKSETNTVHKSEVIPVRTIPIVPDSGIHQVEVSGQFTTDDEVNLSFKITGIVQSIVVKEGDPVKKGQLLATLNMTEIDAQEQQAKISVEKAKRDFQRTSNLYKDSVATLEQLQNSKTALYLAQEQLHAASFNKSHAEIRAPKDGFVLQKLANAGQMVNGGTTILRTNGARSERWKLRVGISDRVWALIQLNDKAEVSIPSLPGSVFPGKVSRKAQGIDLSTGSYLVDITLEDQNSAIASGMFGRATIFPTTKENGAKQLSWAIPYEALLDGDGKNGFVFVTNDGKSAKKVKVTVADIRKDQVIITDGLQDAKALIIAGSAYLNDKSPIQIINQ